MGAAAATGDGLSAAIQAVVQRVDSISEVLTWIRQAAGAPHEANCYRDVHILMAAQRARRRMTLQRAKPKQATHNSNLQQ